jgi:hypothetical protein
MSDEENRREVDSLLGQIVAMHRSVERRSQASLSAAEAFLAEVERDRYSPRLRNLSANYDGVLAMLSAEGQHQAGLILRLDGVLSRWKRPGREYADFAKKARDAADYYSDMLSQLIEANHKVVEEINRIDEAAQGRR